MATKKRSTAKKRATTPATTPVPPSATAATEIGDGHPTNHPTAGRSLLDPVTFADLITLGVIDAPPTE